MNRKTSMLTLVLAGALMSTVCLAAQSSAQCKARGIAALEALTHGKYKAATTHFAPKLAAHVTPAMLKGGWSQLETAFGSFNALGKLTPRTVKDQSVLTAPLTFAKGKLNALITCNGNSQLTSFRLVPAKTNKASGGRSQQATKVPGAAALAKLKAQMIKRQMGPHPPVKAHVEADGVRVKPLAVSSPLGPLRGALTLPAGQGPFPAVLLVQGSGSADLNETIGPNKPFKDIADGLAKLGVASLRYDKPTFAYPQKLAAKADFTVDDEYTHDVLTALDLLARQKAVDPHRVFVLGISEGAMLVPRFAKRDPNLAGAIMMAAPARSFLTVMADQSRAAAQRRGASKAKIAAITKHYKQTEARLDKADTLESPQGKIGGLPISYLLSLHDYHQVAVAKTLSLPLLILQGGSDFQVSPTKDFGKWKQALGAHPNVTFHLYPGLSHLFRPAGKTGTVADYLEPGATDPEVIRDIAVWIKAQQPRHHG